MQSKNQKQSKATDALSAESEGSDAEGNGPRKASTPKRGKRTTTSLSPGDSPSARKVSMEDQAMFTPKIRKVWLQSCNFLLIVPLPHPHFMLCLPFCGAVYIPENISVLLIFLIAVKIHDQHILEYISPIFKHPIWHLHVGCHLSASHRIQDISFVYGVACCRHGENAIIQIAASRCPQDGQYAFLCCSHQVHGQRHD